MRRNTSRLTCNTHDWQHRAVRVPQAKREVDEHAHDHRVPTGACEGRLSGGVKPGLSTPPHRAQRTTATKYGTTEAFVHVLCTSTLCVTERGKGLQLRLELGNVVTGEGERGESGCWRLDG